LGEHPILAYSGSQLIATILKFLVGELRAEIGDYAGRHTETVYNPSDELDCGLSSEGSDLFNLHPI
jgi:hypothetical protein